MFRKHQVKPGHNASLGGDQIQLFVDTIACQCKWERAKHNPEINTSTYAKNTNKLQHIAEPPPSNYSKSLKKKTPGYDQLSGIFS